MKTLLQEMLSAAIAKANAADDAFEAAIKAFGYKSRWDWSQLVDERPYAVYAAKVQADEAMHEAFEKMRQWERGCK
jgi:hypothetical protein